MRIIYGLIVILTEHAVQSISDLNYIRFLGIIGITLTSYVVFHYLKEDEEDDTNALLVALLIGLLIPFQENASYATDFVQPYVCCLSGLAGLIFLKKMEKRTSRSLFLSWKSKAVLILALATYQPAAMFYWVIGLMYLLKLRKTGNPSIYKYSVFYLSNGCLAIIAYFLIFKFGYLILDINAHQPRGNLVSLADIAKKFHFFFGTVLPNSLNLIYISGNHFRMLLVGLLVLVGIFFPLYGKPELSPQASSLGTNVHTVLFILLLLPLSVLPNLVVKSNVVYSRTLLAVAPCLLLLFYNGLKQTSKALFHASLAKRFLKLVLVFLVIFSGHIAHSNVLNYMVVPQTIELRYLLNELRKADLSEIDRIHMIRTSRQGGLAPDDSFCPVVGTSTSGRSWTPKDMIRVGLAEMGADFSGTICVSHGTQDVQSRDNTLVIDMREIKGFKHGPKSNSDLGAIDVEWCLQ